MKYEIRIVERLGPIMASAIGDLGAMAITPRIVVTATGCCSDIGMAVLLRRLDELGVDVIRLRIMEVLKLS